MGEQQRDEHRADAQVAEKLVRVLSSWRHRFDKAVLDVLDDDDPIVVLASTDDQPAKIASLTTLPSARSTRNLSLFGRRSSPPAASEHLIDQRDVARCIAACQAAINSALRVASSAGAAFAWADSPGIVAHSTARNDNHLCTGSAPEPQDDR
ncbi:hypothetical protein [Bradyrhizobium sp. ORS 375]|uniref:hypothetical protein n=1 Tax=Bradyrhizobium sp. (strain ORS 375) TaxID=566679 RepID=UPI000556A552|nr:hypothetical protein [Bradyrhizobium sp. ORS 375]